MAVQTAERSDHDAGDGPPGHFWQSRPVQWSAAAGLLWLTGFIVEHLGAADGVATALYVVAIVAGVRYFAREALEELVREREVGIELLMLVAAVMAGVLGLWGEAATLAFLYSISEALEEFTEDRTRHAIRALMDLAPPRVTRLTADNRQEDIDLDELRVNDRFLVRPGESVATDGEVLDGRTAVNEAAITGESLPVEKGPGDRVFAGTLNTSGALTVRATATVADNTLAKIVKLVSEAQEAKGKGEQFMQRFARVYSPAVLLVGAVVLFGGGLLDDWSTWAERAATVIVAAAPCALVIAIPVSYVAAIGNASRKGVLIKGGVYLEALARLRVLAMDKTGTITRGQPEVVAVQPVDGTSEAELLRLAAAVEQRSEHPLARAVVNKASQHGQPPDVKDFTSLIGAGAEGTVDGKVVVIGSPTLMQQRGLTLDGLDDGIRELQAAGRTAVLVGVDNRVIGALGIADVVRPQAREAIAALHGLGVDRVIMLTGDNQLTAAAVAEQVGLDGYEAELKPEDKSGVIERLIQEHGPVGMVGDGVNDAPALATATVGIAMGTAGSDVALETADVALMADDLSRLVDAVRIGRRTRQIVRQNIILSLVILAVLVPGALFGVLSLPIAVLAHELSELVVIMNGLRLGRR